jgi:hypothetical protein
MRRFLLEIAEIGSTSDEIVGVRHRKPQKTALGERLAQIVFYRNQGHGLVTGKRDLSWRPVEISPS